MIVNEGGYNLKDTKTRHPVLYICCGMNHDNNLDVFRGGKHNMESSTLIKHALQLSVFTGELTPMDILIENGNVIAAEENISLGEAQKVIDVEGAYLSCGWVDAHTHCYGDPGTSGVDVMATHPCDGVTCLVDAGTAGPANYDDLHEKTIINNKMNIKTYLNIARHGISKKFGELESMENIDALGCRQIYEKYKNEIIGIKLRIDSRVNCNSVETLKAARKIADELDLPVIVHASRSTSSLEEILGLLKKGDVYAHSYASLAPCIIDDDGVLKQSAIEARARGVWFDLSHGVANFSFDIARKAMEQDFLIDTISTDLHPGNINGPVHSLPMTMSKMLHLGLDLASVIRLSTAAPVKMLGLSDKQLDISVGKPADLTIFTVETGSFSLLDGSKKTETASKIIAPKLTVIGSSLFYPRTEAKLITY